MIIKSICLDNFGKFHGKVVEFSKGMNILYGENEAGKTTLHTFIKGMLFGLDSRNLSGSDGNEYDKYVPWDDHTNYKGSMVIEADGVEYRIERNFLKSERSCKIFRVDTRRELGKEEIDKLFYGFDEKCYYNTISISQLGSITSKELEKVLKNYASNLGSTKTTEISVEDALNELENTKDKLIQEGNADKKEEYEEEADNILDEIKQTEAEERMAVNEIEDNRDKINQLRAKIKALEELDTVQTERQIKKNLNQENLLQKMEMIQLDIDRVEKSKEQAEAHRDELEAQLSEYGIHSKQEVEREIEWVLSKSNFNIWCIVVFVVALSAAVGFFINDGYGYIKLNYIDTWWKEALCALVAIGSIVTFVAMYFVNKKRKKDEIKALKDLKITVDKYDAAKHEVAYAEKQIRVKQKELNSIAFTLQADKENKDNVSDYNTEISQIKDEISGLRDDKTKIQVKLEQKKESLIKLNKQLEKLNEKLEKIKAVEEELSAVDDAKQTILDISEEVRKSFGRDLNKRASVYMSNITNSKYENITIDEELNMYVEAWTGRMIPVEKLSKGTIEQMYMSLRLAAADIIFEGDSKPILLDDAFVMYDNKRMANTMRFMAKNLEQVIIFSCHTREKVMADKLKLDYKLLLVNEK